MKEVSSTGWWSRCIPLLAFALFLLSPQISLAQNSFQLLSQTTVGTSAPGASFANPTVIGSSTLTLSCPAQPTATLSNTADGTGYVLVDNYLTLSVNGTPVAPIEGPAFSPAGNVCNGGVTDGFNNTTQQDCFSQAYRTAATTNNSLNGLNTDSITNAGSDQLGGQPGGVPPINIGGYLPANTTSQVSIQLLDAGGYVASSSIYLITNCNRGTTQPLTSGDNGIIISSDFSTPAGTLAQEIIIPPNNNNPNGSDEISSTNQPIACDPTSNPPYAEWHQFVVGTPWAVSHCAPHIANGPNRGTLYVNACWNSALQSLANASDAFCPTVDPNGDQGDIILEDIFDWPKEPIANGATASLIAFTPPFNNPYLVWAPSADLTNPVCTNILTGACFLFDTLYEMFGDQTTTRGTSPKTKSWEVTAIDTPTALTMVLAAPNAASPAAGTSACPLSSPAMLNDVDPTSATYENPSFTVNQNLWFNGNCLLKFVVNQAVVPPSLAIPANGPIPANNNFVAAPVSNFLYGLGTDKTAQDITVANNPPSAQFTPALNGLTLAGFLNSYNTSLPVSLHWSAVDIAGIIEKNIQLVPAAGAPPSCPVPPDVTGGPVSAPVGGQCYMTSFYTVLVDLDSVAPQLNGTCTQTPAAASPYGWYNTDVTLNCAASDVTSGIRNANPLLAGVPAPANAAVNFSVATSVGPGNANPSASTSTQTLCDYASNCLQFSQSGFAIDEVPPTVSPITLSPANATNTYIQNQNVTATFTCNDVGSGLVGVCTGTGGVVSGGAINTSALGPQTFTVTANDKAGNQTTRSVNYTVLATPADVGMFEGFSSDVVKHGTTYNYPAWTLDLTKGVSAQGVTVTGTITIPTSDVGGNVSGKVAIVSCSLSNGCAAMTVGSACTPAPSTVNGSNTILTISCNVGTLQSIYNLQGARVQLMIPVSSTATIGSMFRIDARVSSDNDPNAKNNAVSDIITVK